jgi:hypothetical protein
MKSCGSGLPFCVTAGFSRLAEPVGLGGRAVRLPRMKTTRRVRHRAQSALPLPGGGKTET